MKKKKRTNGVVIVIILIGIAISIIVYFYEDINCNNNYDDVLVVTNANSEISKQISNYFMTKREITHQVFISTTESEWTDFNTFNNSIRRPIEEYLINNNLVKKINYIVTTKGVPLAFNSCGSSNGCGSSVNDALTIILSNNSNKINNNAIGNNRVINPTYKIKNFITKEKDDIYMVTRLDGKTYEDIIGLITENVCNNMKGITLLDSTPGKTGSGYIGLTTMIYNTNSILLFNNHIVLFENTSQFVINQDNIDGYFSWGSNDGNASANSSTWNLNFNPGSIGDTAVSSSGRTFNNWSTGGQSLITDLVSMGISGVKGYVAEPYVTAISNPEELFINYYEGFDLVTSFYVASPYINWQGVIIGDPKIMVK